VFLWVPAHVGVETDEELDKLAKQSVKLTDINIKLSKKEVKGRIY